MSRHFWTDSDLAVLREHYPHEQTATTAARLGRKLAGVYNKALKLGLRKSAAYLASPASGRLRKGSHPNSAAHRFTPGQTPANKGLRRPGWGPGRMRATQFKPGHGRSGVAAVVWKPIGTERVSKDGYLERKIHNNMPLQSRWRAVHLLVWEEANGPLPKGYAVAFRNGDKRDICLENLELIARADLMRRNTVHNLPKELARTIQLIGALRRQINKRTPSEKQDRRSA